MAIIRCYISSYCTVLRNIWGKFGGFQWSLAWVVFLFFCFLPVSICTTILKISAKVPPHQMFFVVFSFEGSEKELSFCPSTPFLPVLIFSKLSLQQKGLWSWESALSSLGSEKRKRKGMICGKDRVWKYMDERIVDSYRHTFSTSESNANMLISSHKKYWWADSIISHKM